MKYRKKTVVIEATQWFENGDHPKDSSLIRGTEGESFLTEGKIVRRYRNPNLPLEKHSCPRCSKKMHTHGWVDTLEDGHTVCPGDWIITGVKGEYYPCKPDIFEMTYEKVE